MSDEPRLIELETKVAYAEDMLAELNDVVIRQERRIDQLEAQQQHLIKLLEAPRQEAGADPEPPPPHY